MENKDIGRNDRRFEKANRKIREIHYENFRYVYNKETYPKRKKAC